MSLPENVQYCSLDIETSGFDPKTCEVLEVGLAFFTVTPAGLRVTREWTCVCKPRGEVPPHILSLTGISKDELEHGKDFSEYADELQDLVRDAVIVGHNIVFDVHFLENFGIRFSGSTVDTMDLVQFLLPTHHSYNLESLMHVFSVPYADAHRALSDSRACIVVLEKLLRLFNGFSEATKKDVLELASRGNFDWLSMLQVPLEPLALPESLDSSPSAAVPLQLNAGTVYELPAGVPAADTCARALSEHALKSLVVVPRQWTALRLWKEGLAQLVTVPEQQFDEKKFSKFLESDLSADELRFALKVLVWKRTNWQTKNISDLNLSFFGGQFRQFITGGRLSVRGSARVLCADLETFERLSQSGQYGDRLVALVGIGELERHMSSHVSTTVHWSKIAYLAKSYFHPELEQGNSKYKQPVMRLLNAADLFFGLTVALLNEDREFSYWKVTSENEYSEAYGKVRAAAGHFSAVLRETAALLGSDELHSMAEKLDCFFVTDDSRVKWIEMAANRCVFHSAPLDIRGIVERMLKPYSSVVFVDSVGSREALSYFMQRLGIDSFPVEFVPTRVFGAIQGDLFAGGKKRPILKIESTSPTPEDLLSVVGTSALPAAVLLPGNSAVKQFSDSHYEKLKQLGSLLVQNGGGSSRLFRNFSIHPNSILLATDKFILKSLSSGTTGTIEHLPVKTLILCHLPFEQFTHPYQEAVASQFLKPFEQYSLPKAVYNLHVILDFFYTKHLEEVRIMDSKLAKEYAKVFIEYIKKSDFFRVL